MPPQILYGTAALLAVGAAPLPYGYYTLLRLVACIVFSIATYLAHQRQLRLTPYVCAAFALLFNPVIPVHLTKALWALLDVGAAVYLVLVTKYLRDRPNNSLERSRER